MRIVSSIGFSLTLLALIGCTGGADDDPAAGSSAGRPTTTQADQPESIPIPDGPNILLISIDTLRADHLGCYGYDRPTSPTLDRLATEGVLFEDCSAPAPWTIPSHVSLLTGLYPNQHGARSMDPGMWDVDKLAEVLKAKGYATGAVINHYLLQDARLKLQEGFDSFKYVSEIIIRPDPSQVHDAGEQWLAKRRERPFFLFLHFFDVHSDYVSLPKYEQQFVGEYSGHATGKTLQLMDAMLGGTALDEADIRHLIDLYDAGICQIDAGIKRMLNALKANDLFDDTIVVITSDHGEQFMEHGSVLHGQNHFQEVIRVPLIMRGPGIPKGRRVQTMASLIDVMPTLLSLLDVPAPAGLDGIDLAPLWDDDPAQAADRYLFAEADHGYRQSDQKRVVRNSRFKLHFDRLDESIELYDLESDPGEQHNVAADHKDVVKSLRKELAAFMDSARPAVPTTPLTPEEDERMRALGYIK